MEYYESSGISDLYPPQVTCVEAGLFDHRDLLIAIPTASGKTLVAEMAMHHHITRNGKCLYIVPLKALASEKYQEFSGKDASIGIATGDYDRRDEHLGQYDIVIATSEKVDSLLRNSTRWLGELSLLVVDEIHLIDSEDRGATLEMVITKLRSQNPHIQIIALSATIGNPEILGGWLDAEVITSEWRPVDLHEGVYYRGGIRFPYGVQAIQTPTKDDDINLCLDSVGSGGQCLVFVSSRRNAEGFAKRAASALNLSSDALTELQEQLMRLAETDMGKALAACAGVGAAFHHAGLKAQQRHLVEQGFRNGHLKVIASTPTLAAGLNLPARRVVIRDYLRYQTGLGMIPIPVREYRQMAGRAGRPHLDPYGEAVLIAKREELVDDLILSYIDAPSEDITSKLATESALTTHILSLVATGFVRSRTQLLAFLQETYYAYQHKFGRTLPRVIDQSVSFLEDARMITEKGDDSLQSTAYGSLVSRLYIDPRGANMITGILADDLVASPVGLLHLLCMTPDMFRLYVKRNDLPVLERFLFQHEEEIWVEFDFDAGEEYYTALKTALLLNDWIEELGEGAICERYGVGPGDIYNVVDGIAWLLHAASRLASMTAPGIAPFVSEVELRMKHGIRRELLPLVRLRGIGRIRARRLFNNNITSIPSIRAAGPDRIAQILGRGIADQIFAQLDEDHCDEPGNRERSEQVSLLHFR
jgi:helicase